MPRATTDRTRMMAQAWRHNNPVNTLFYSAYQRSKRKKLEFNITKEDIIIPEYCPVLGSKLENKYGTCGHKEDSPTLDRIDNGQGYVKGNVRVISFRANRLKSSNTRETLLKLLDYVDGKL